MKRDIRLVREAMLDLTGILNRPQPDAALIETAGVDLDRALLPLLVRIERRGPLGVKELAELSGRDYTTVSRQVAKLEGLGLVSRAANAGDARIREQAVTDQGRAVVAALDAAREKLMTALFADWDKQELADLARLLRKFSVDALAFARGLGKPGEGR